MQSGLWSFIRGAIGLLLSNLFRGSSFLPTIGRAGIELSTTQHARIFFEVSTNQAA